MESGLRLTERYRLVERLDEGGTMEVWRAWDELLGRPVAVKLLSPAHTGLHRAFEHGVNQAAGLSHPAVETVFDSDRTRDASGRLVPYVVTEFLDGETLEVRLRRGPLTASETTRIVAEIAEMLKAAHLVGVPHGDLSTAKIHLVHGDVKVADMGIGGVVRSVREPSGDGTAPVTSGAAVEEAKASDVRGLGAVIAACLPARAPAELAALAERCAAATAGNGPSAGEVADLVAPDDEPPNTVFGTVRAADPSRDERTRTLGPLSRPLGGRVRPAGLALAIAVPVTAAAAMLASALVSAPRDPVAVPTPPRTQAAVPPPPAYDKAPARTTAVTEALGRLRPIVHRGYSSGQIRPDVAIDLNNVITNLENELTSDQDVDVEQRIGLLRDKIATREREQALSPDLAAELTGVLATIQT
ncbi:MAG TPA: protein kinase [Spirillospora sp.]